MYNPNRRHKVQSLVSGVPHASFRRYPTEVAAMEAFQEAWKGY
jgi:hypothetical protein